MEHHFFAQFPLPYCVDFIFSQATEYRKDFYFFFKEAITNAAKHGQAKSAGAHIRKVEPFILLQIQDDGCGFDQDEVKRAMD